MTKSLELIGKIFGHLTVVSRVKNSKKGSTRWLCNCSCGNRHIAVGNELKSGHTKSCGCINGLTAQEYLNLSRLKAKDSCFTAPVTRQLHRL